MIPEPSETRVLVGKARTGDRDAFQLLAEMHRERLVRFAHMMISDRSEAEDIAQEALAQAFEKLDTFQDRSKFGSWVTGIVLNLCRHRLRDRKRHARSASLSKLDGAGPKVRGVLSSVARRELGERIADAVKKLPTSMREAFVLRFVEGADYDEIAEITGVPAGTARVRAHRARTLLQAGLANVVESFWLESGEKPPTD